ncbi:DUF1152 domain-containing protein [Dactylosporangium vinaceum]|uniref:DUF1152 domain-containing protein n=1 Tax=Dactylosporangium vinaceum TaxID=53362 RepID=A0ABV5ME00_9ACTN|nr:DUF1152 domain-containing protein [Dactylosporangium vinaceum]UAC01007.1 DUF1152 domain-containing protein [Dactylosporangium vinaceum]
MTESLGVPPLFAALRDCERVLIAGAGGGFDVYAGLPLAFALQERGVDVHLGNLSFAPLHRLDLDVWVGPDLARIDADTEGLGDYFPERTLARWLEQRGRAMSVYAFAKVGVLRLREAYQQLVEQLRLDAVVLVDGGTDILMRGDEAGLGTPVEDITSLAAVNGLDVPVRLVTCLGFGIDAFHGVVHTQVLENLAALDRDGGYLGALSIPSRSQEAQLYCDAVAHAQDATASWPSIVNGQIAAALRGESGDVHITERTGGSTLFVNPLMAVYFTVDLAKLADRCLYLDRLEATVSEQQVLERIAEFRAGVARRPARPFPH